VVLGDGYVGMNVIPRREGALFGARSFGIEVDDLDDTIAAHRPNSIRRWAQVSALPSALRRLHAHESDTNIFDLSGPRRTEGRLRREQLDQRARFP